MSWSMVTPPHGGLGTDFTEIEHYKSMGPGQVEQEKREISICLLYHSTENWIVTIACIVAAMSLACRFKRTLSKQKHIQP